MHRHHVVASVHGGFLSAVEGAQSLGCTKRHLYRLLRRFELEGLGGLFDKRIGRPSNNRLPAATVERAVEIFERDLLGYGPTLAAEILDEEYGIKLSRETLRQILIERSLWIPKSKSNRQRRVPQLRSRYPNVGDLVQFDGTFYEWIPDQGVHCLLTFIDDATSRIMHLALVEEETADNYLREWKTYIRLHGCPRRVLGDQHAAIFRKSKSTSSQSPRLTSDLARALSSLGIHCLSSTTAAGRGRVERLNRTLQDRLEKFLRRRQPSTIEEANSLLADFIRAFNARLAKPPARTEDHHFPPPRFIDLDTVFTRRWKRRVSARLSLSLHGRALLLPDNFETRALVSTDVLVAQTPDGDAFALADERRFRLSSCS